jgi:hypothetical protein
MISGIANFNTLPQRRSDTTPPRPTDNTPETNSLAAVTTIAPPEYHCLLVFVCVVPAALGVVL